MGDMAYNHSCTQIAASSMATPFAHYLRPSMDRIRLLLVSSSHHSSFRVKLTKSAVMKLYALFTLHETGWGTRAGVGDRTSYLLKSYDTDNQQPPLRKQQRKIRQEQVMVIMQTHARTLSTSNHTEGNISLIF